MTAINIQEAKANLSRHAKRVKAGETLILCERNKPIAEIRPMASGKRKVRLGLYKNQIGMADDFNAPLPEFAHSIVGHFHLATVDEQILRYPALVIT